MNWIVEGCIGAACGPMWSVEGAAAVGLIVGILTFIAFIWIIVIRLFGVFTGVDRIL